MAIRTVHHRARDHAHEDIELIGYGADGPRRHGLARHGDRPLGPVTGANGEAAARRLFERLAPAPAAPVGAAP